MSDIRALGADISHHQNTFTFLGNLDFVVLRATRGLSEDRRFRQHLLEAMKIPVRGAYHYLLSAEPWDDQLQRFLAVTAGAELHFLALDFEKIDNTLGRPFAAAALQWLDAISAAIEKPVLFYTNPATWSEGLMPFLSVDERERLAARELWVAQWPRQPDETAARTIQLPFLAPGMRHWTLWQFSADFETHPPRGAEFGVSSSHIDLNVYNGTREALQQRMLGGAAPVRVPPERVEERPAGPVVEPPVDEIPGLTNQAMINVFFRVAAALGVDGFEMIQRAGLESMAIPDSNRVLPYAGPAIDALPGLLPLERMLLRTALKQAPEAPADEFVTWERRAVPGLHGPADPGGGWVPEAFEVVQQSRVRAIKMLVPDLQPEEVARLREISPDMFIMARLFSNQLGEPRGDGTPEGAGRWLAEEVAAAGDGNNPMNRAFNAGLRFFEVHNEPNLTVEGLGVNWRDGAEFARFFQAAVEVLRPRYPGAQFGFPGLSPGPVGGPRLIDAAAFLEQAAAAVEPADFLCCHVYWGQEGVDLRAALEQLREFCARFPRKRIICSEFSNNNPNLEREAKAVEYARFYRACQSLPPNLGAMFAYALSWRDDRNREGFLELHEDGQRWKPTPMALALGGQGI